MREVGAFWIHTGCSQECCKCISFKMWRDSLASHWRSSHSCLPSPKIPNLPCCPFRNTPMARGSALPEHRDLVFLVTPSQSHTGNPSQQRNSGFCNSSPPATQKSPEERQDGKQWGISMEKQVQRGSPEVTNATVWHLLSSDWTILMGFTRPKQLHTLLRAAQLNLLLPLNHEAQPNT